jgi:hypothetical protein
VVFEGGSPLMANNLIYTDLAPDQAVLLCAGAETDGAELKNNLLTTFPQGGTNAVLIDCEGKFTTTSEFISDPAGLTLDGAAVSGNIAYQGGQNGMFNAVVDKGLDASGEVYGKVVKDYDGNARPAGNGYDIGATEK